MCLPVGALLRGGRPVKEMDYINFESLLDDLKEINVQQGYWMIRTMGGSYYGDFVRNNYVAIGYNDISLRHLNQLPDTENAAKEELKRLFHERYPNYSNSGYPVAQLLHFARDIKRNDIVIIPSASAVHVAIGVVTGDLYEESHPVLDDEHYCTFKKRRPVEWKFYGRRSTLPPSLQLMFNSRHILSNVSGYAPYVDSVINDCYVKDEVFNLVLRIRTQKAVSLDDFCDLKAISILIYDFSRKYGISSEGTLDIKIQMESPGWLRLSTKAIGLFLLFGLFTVALTGGGLRFKQEDGWSLYTKGISGAINDYLDREADRELVRAAARAIDSLQIKKPEDLQPIIDLLNAKNEGREKY